jgi:ferredoxin-NADP reductase
MTELVLVGKVPVARDVVVLTFRDPTGGELPTWTPGAHVDLVLRPDSGTPLVRQYSLCGDPGDRSAWRVAVLRESAGRGGSRMVHDELGEGSRVRVVGPRNHFPLLDAGRYLFIAGGIGITPILPMLTAAQARGAPWRLVYGGRSRESMAFAAHLREAYPDRVRLCPQDEVGLLDLDSLLRYPEPGTLVYCCGPAPLLDAVQERCRIWPPGTLHVERFSPLVPLGPKAPFEVELAVSGRTLAVPAEQSILETVEKAGITVLSSCREGTCGTCETGVLDGVPDHRDSLLTEQERSANDTMMICVSRALTPRLVLDL